jgi:hypothetical protein
MLTERLRVSGNGAGIAFANPLDLRVGSPVAVAYANGPEFADYSFTVQRIREYTRRTQGQEFRSNTETTGGTQTSAPARRRRSSSSSR